MEAKRTRLTEARKREILGTMTQDERLARQRRKDKQMKQKIAMRQHKHAAGGEPEDFSSSGSDDSLLDDEEIMLIEKKVFEDDDDEVEVQNISSDPQRCALVCTSDTRSLRPHTLGA